VEHRRRSHTQVHSLEYRKAFLACRKHRIDLNFLVEHNTRLFSENVGSFVDQIPEVDHLTLFLSGIGCAFMRLAAPLLLTSGYRQSKSQAPDKIASLCDSLRLELEKRGLVKYMSCILTSYVVKTPPDYEAALSLMHRLRRTSLPVVFVSALTT
jgi:elongator complex protein 1